MTHWSKPDPKRYARAGTPLPLAVQAKLAERSLEPGATDPEWAIVHPYLEDDPRNSGARVCVGCGAFFVNALQGAIHLNQAHTDGQTHLLAWWSGSRFRVEEIEP